MLCIEQMILILLMRAVVECCISGHISMARCIRLLCAALVYNTSMRNAIFCHLPGN